MSPRPIEPYVPRRVETYSPPDPSAAVATPPRRGDANPLATRARLRAEHGPEAWQALPKEERDRLVARAGFLARKADEWERRGVL